MAIPIAREAEHEPVATLLDHLVAAQCALSMLRCALVRTGADDTVHPQDLSERVAGLHDELTAIGRLA